MNEDRANLESDEPAGGPPPSRFAFLREKTSVLCFLMSLAIIAILAAGVAYKCVMEEREAIETANIDTGNLARAVEEHAVRTFEAANSLAIQIKYRYERGYPLDLAAIERIDPRATEVFQQYAVAGENGMVVASNLPMSANVNLSDREHFKIHIPKDTGELYISRPVLGRVSGKWSIQLTRRLNLSDGSFGGMVVVSLDPFYFSQFYRQLDIGRQGSIVMVGLDGVVRARRFMDDLTIGQNIGHGKLLSLLGSGMDSGNFETVGLLSGVRELFSFRRIKGFPLAVAVGLSRDEALADFNTRRNVYFVFTAVLSLMILSLSVWMARLLHVQRIEAERRREQERLLDAVRVAEAASEAKSAFLATVSHELKTPLNMIFGTMQLLEASELSPEQADYVKMGLASANRLLGLIDRILDLVSLETEGHAAPQGEMLLSDLFHALSLDFEERLREKNLDYHVRVSPETPNLIVGNARCLQAVLTNLIDNAVKFTERGGIELLVETAGRPGPYEVRLRFRVADTGPGLSDPALGSKLFTPFGLHDTSLSRRHQGAGLGLAVAKHMVDLMGGDIRLKSAPGQGTTVEFEITAGLPDAQAARDSAGGKAA